MTIGHARGQSSRATSGSSTSTLNHATGVVELMEHARVAGREVMVGHRVDSRVGRN